MKKYICLIFIFMLLLNFSCGTNSNMTAEKNFVPPVQLNNPRLLYPKVAQEYAHTGNAKVLFEINKEGKVIKAVITESSGSDMLDSSAVEYCRSLIFKPAKIGRQDVPLKMTKQIKFQISNFDQIANAYVVSVKKLYRKLEYSDIHDRLNIERQILLKHIDFVREMRDALNFNVYAKEVLSAGILDKWSNDWDSWPLSFLIFYDFMQRFPEYDSLQKVKKLMFGALNYDIKYIRNTPAAGRSSVEQKDNILKRIKHFIDVNYPGSKLDDMLTRNSVPISLEM